MSNVGWLIYWAEVFGNLRGVALGFVILGGLVMLGFAIFYFVTFSDNNEEMSKGLKSVTRILTVLFGASVLVLLFVPSQSTMVAMYVVPKIANNEKLNALADDGLDTLGNLLKFTSEWAKDLANEHKPMGHD